MNDPQSERDLRIADLLDAARARESEQDSRVESSTAAEAATDDLADLLNIAEDLDAAVQDWRMPDETPPRDIVEPPSLVRKIVPGGRYTIISEIGRGGMGVVYRATDGDLQRPLAVKVLSAKRSTNADDTVRFLEEARITGQLQHPGVAPVHEVGRLADGRPFFAMKLISGRTLADLLRERPTVAADLPRFLTIFEQIAQTMAYAHAQAIIHRDLKPANVMVGSFGEVQVMDWGLAKRLRQAAPHKAGAAPTPPSADHVAEATAIQYSALAITETGTVLGTPAFMPPEQARGGDLDRRVDVFGLGAILCVILTGKPPYDSSHSLALETLGPGVGLADAYDRLDACGADAVLIALAKDCLGRQPEDRPSDAAIVAQRIGAFLASVQERLRAAEIQRAADQARAIEERKRRRILAAVGVAAVVIAAGIGFAVVRDRQVQAETEARRKQGIIESLDYATQVRDRLQTQLAKHGGVFEQLDRPREWESQIEATRAALTRAANLGAESTRLDGDLEHKVQELTALVAQDEADHALAQRLDAIMIDRATWRRGGFDLERPAREYAEAFTKAGLNLERDDTERLAKAIRGSAVKEQLVAALDDWALLVWHKDAALHESLLAVARQAAPGDSSDRLRQPETWNDRLALEKMMTQLAREPKALARLSPTLLKVVGDVHMSHRGNPVAWLRQAQLMHPGDFFLNFAIGTGLSRTNPVEGAGYLRTALGIRPRNTAAWNNLGAALFHQKRFDEAATAYQKAVEFDPKHVLAWTNLGHALSEQGKQQEALAAYKESLAIQPDDAPTWRLLGQLLDQQQKVAEAEDAFHKATRAAPKNTDGWHDLGVILYKHGKLAEAVEAFRMALDLDPRQPLSWTSLGMALAQLEKFDDAVAAYRKALALTPNDADAWHELGGVYVRQDKLNQAALALAKSVSFDPRRSDTHMMLGQVLLELSQFAEAAKSLREFEKLAPAVAATDKTTRAVPAGARFKAACAAAKAATSQGADAAALDDAQRACLRRQALGWLNADLTVYRQLLADGPAEKKKLVQDMINHLPRVASLAGLRESEALAKLPVAEQAAWRKFWTEVEQLGR